MDQLDHRGEGFSASWYRRQHAEGFVLCPHGSTPAPAAPIAPAAPARAAPQRPHHTKNNDKEKPPCALNPKSPARHLQLSQPDFVATGGPRSERPRARAPSVNWAFVGGFRVWVQGTEFRVEGLGFRV